MTSRDERCCVCESTVDMFGIGRVLHKYNVKFFRCTKCGFIQTEEPYWLAEAYTNAIAASDIGYVSRNVGMSNIVRAVITAFFNRHGTFVDYGGGYGLFVRLMRDVGYNFLRYDTHCPNLFAQGFEWNNQHTNVELVTSFEVFEHLVDPVSEVTKMRTISPSILFSTLLLPEPAPPLNDWWYYVLEYGQHISFYSRRSLTVLAERVRENIITNETTIHLLNHRHLPSAVFKIALSKPFLQILYTLGRRRSLLPQDLSAVFDRKALTLG